MLISPNAFHSKGSTCLYVGIAQVVQSCRLAAQLATREPFCQAAGESLNQSSVTEHLMDVNQVYACDLVREAQPYWDVTVVIYSAAAAAAGYIDGRTG